MALTLRRYSPADAPQWNDFIRTAKNGLFMFERGYMDYHADRFTDHSLMVQGEDGKLLAVMPANQDGSTLHSHQGLTFGGFISGRKMRAPLMMQVFDSLAIYARQNGIEKLIYKSIPYFYASQPAQEDLYALFRAGATCYRLDISSTIDYKTTPYAFSASRKSGLAKARAHALEVRESDDFTTFFAMMNVILGGKYQTSAVHSPAEMALLQSRFPHNIRLFGCFKQQEMLAGTIIYETPLVAHTQYISSTPAGKEAGAGDVILDELINRRYTKTKNYFDFGISTDFAGRHLNEKLIDQKEGTGARSTAHQFYELLF